MINKKHLSHRVFFILIIFISIFLRFYKLGVIPGVLNRDEASLGYNAFSLLQTGKEEHGVSWPVNIESFGDWKLPGYIYTLIPFISLFGLNDFVVRLPSAISGVGIVILGYFLIRQLSYKYSKSLELSLITMLFTAVSPWAVHMSRIAYEANLALLFFLIGFNLFLVVLKSSIKSNKIFFLYWLSIVFFTLTLYTYHAYQVFTPLFLLFLLISNYKKIKNHFKENLPGMLTILITGCSLLIFLFLCGAKDASATKFSGLSIFDLDSYLPSITKQRLFFTDQGFFTKFYANKGVAFIEQLGINVFNVFSPQFLFISGGSNGAHNISGYGNFYRLSAVFILIGLWKMIHEKKPWQKIIMWWILIAAVAPVITFESNHTIRFSPGFFALELVSAYGFLNIINFLNKKINKKAFWPTIGKILLIITIIHQTMIYSIHYFYIFPRKDIDRWPWYMQRLSSLIFEMKEDPYDLIIMQGESSSPYIYFLYYAQLDPEYIQNNIKYYPATNEGFRHVKSIGKRYQFKTIDWNNPEFLNKNVLFVIQPDEISIDKRENSSYSLEQTLTHPDSKYIYELWSYHH